MIRDEELKRLEAYAKALGVKITRKPQGKNDPGAEWTVDGTEIIIYRRRNESKTQQILKLIHELAHHRAWLANGRKGNLITDQALSAHDEKKGKINKKLRKIIYTSEKNDMKYWDEIINDVNIKINPKKIELEKNVDLWMYYQWYLTGNYPSREELIEFRAKRRKELK